MAADINWLFAKTSPELRDVGDRNVVQRPQSVFIEGSVTLSQTDFDTIRQQIVLPNKISFLNKSI